MGVRLYEYSDTLYIPETKGLRDLPEEELVEVDDRKLWGRVLKGVVHPRDFVWVPPGCTHRVKTYEDTFGITGYIRLPEDEYRIAQVCEWYESKGLNPGDGIYCRHTRI